MVDDTENLDRLLEKIVQKQPDLVEFRLDALDEFSAIERIAHSKSYPAIATIKSKQEAVARKVLLSAASAGFEFVDVDMASPQAQTTIKEVKSSGAEAIVSFHDHSRTPPPSDLRTILDSEIVTGGDICKIVTTASHSVDNLNILNLLNEKPADVRLVAFAMGRKGVSSRILSPLFGGEFTFASLTESSKTADGQLTIDELRSVWQLLGVR